MNRPTRADLVEVLRRDWTKPAQTERAGEIAAHFGVALDDALFSAAGIPAAADAFTWEQFGRALIKRLASWDAHLMERAEHHAVPGLFAADLLRNLHRHHVEWDGMSVDIVAEGPGLLDVRIDDPDEILDRHERAALAAVGYALATVESARAKRGDAPLPGDSVADAVDRAMREYAQHAEAATA